MKRLRLLGFVTGLWLWSALVAHLAVQPSSGVIWRNLAPALWLFDGQPLEATYIGSPFLSMQQVAVVMSGGTSSSATATLSPALHLNVSSAVDSALLVWQGVASGDNSAHITYDDFAIGTITNSTTVTVTKPGAGTYALTWYGLVVDFVPRFIKSRGCGTIAIADAATTGTALVSATMGKAVVMPTGWTNGITGAAGQILHVVAGVQQQDATHFVATRAGTALSGTSLTVGYCYVERP